MIKVAKVLIYLVLMSQASVLALAGPIGIAQLNGFVHDSTGLLVQLDSTSPTFFSTLDANNIGTFGWTFTNHWQEEDIPK